MGGGAFMCTYTYHLNIIPSIARSSNWTLADITYIFNFAHRLVIKNEHTSEAGKISHIISGLAT
jgi:hypothetical protein